MSNGYYEECDACDGTGESDGYDRAPCFYCRGSGVVWVPCSAPDGTGDDAESEEAQ